MRDKKLRRFLGINDFNTDDGKDFIFDYDAFLQQEIIERIKQKIYRDEITKCDGCGYLIWTKDATEKNIITPIKKKKENKDRNRDWDYSYDEPTKGIKEKRALPIKTEEIIQKYYCKNCLNNYD